jgi:hypothetical protein
MRNLISMGLLAAAVCVPPAVVAGQSQPASAASLAGGWTRNQDLSDAPPGSGQGNDSGRSAGRNGGGGGGGRHGGGGGYGGRGGGMGRGGGNAAPQMNPDEVARMREAMRAVTDPSDHLVITQTDSMIVVTSADGRTTRLSADGKKIKDENTGVERKTKWDGGKLVSEIHGLGDGKITQSFSIDPEHKQLRIIVLMEGGRSGGPHTITQVYDADTK